MRRISLISTILIFSFSFLLSGCSGKEEKGSSSPDSSDTAGISSSTVIFSSGSAENTSNGTKTSSSAGEKNESSDIASVSSADLSDMDFSFSDRDLSAEYDKNNKAEVDLTSSVVSGNGAQIKNDTLYITSEGTYTLSGSYSEMITVEAGENDKVQLVLDGVTIKNAGGPAIYVKSADKVFITVKDGTKNSISDGSSYTLTDGDTSVDAAIFSKADLTINGSGTLTINGACKHAVISKDDLVISDATLNVTAKNVGLGGKDCIKINGGNITVTAGSDALRSDNTEDASRGYIYIEGGKLNLTAANDAIQAETVLKINNAQITAKTGGGSVTSFSSSSESSKGFKAGSDIVISGGSFTLDCLDDCVHSNGTITIGGGTFKLSSGDDGVHADTDLAISGGEITVTKSYEGFESSKIVISGGKHSVTASDDGLNAAGGNDGSAMGGRPGQGMFSSQSGEIVISGGYILVNSNGDGIDSNGTVSVTGGVTLVSGPTNNGNGSFDYDGSASVSGGVLIALGSSGMAQSFIEAQNQGAIFTSFSSQSGGTSFALCDKNGKVVCSFTPAKAYQTAVVTAPEIKSGESYSIVAGGTVSSADANGFAQNTTISNGTTLAEIEMTSSLYGGSGNGMHGGGGGMQRPGRPW
ncbi:MAG: carbohydrate-binding domain-containing protein [Oscillospiraceae bacterium]|nr:carbohydrate-binding domain-containing protein [Oscillospiraceae bacterium]